MLSIDIFCQVIDNYGDAGVCVRLARQLYKRGHQIKIYTDKPEIFQQIYAQDKFPIYNWSQAQTAVKNGLVIEAFACELPETYKSTIKYQNSIWLNLEYLSAEPWVNNFHGLASPQNDGADKYFFFPGFNNKTGGLLRDNDEIKKYSQLKSARTQEIEAICKTKLASNSIANHNFFIFLFCYPNAPLFGLQQALANIQPSPHVLLLGGAKTLSKQANIINVPFLQQTDFDRLLWLSDLNFVRGEDSLAQASWCPTPMVWQAYVQQDNAHLDKLKAWLELQRLPRLIADFILAWNQTDNNAVAKILPQILQSQLWSQWQLASKNRTHDLLAQDDLCTNIEQFYYRKMALS